MKSNIKQLALTATTYAIVIILSTVLFIALFHMPLLKGLDVFFYRGCIFLVIASIAAVGMILLAAKIFPKLELDAKDAFAVFFMFFGLTLGWFTLLPVTVERSISVFMLSYMDQNDQSGITSDDFGNIFYQKYIKDFGAFEKRFHEQDISGNIQKASDENGYVITDNGRFIVTLFRICSDLFDTEQWLVYPNDYISGVKYKD